MKRRLDDDAEPQQMVLEERAFGGDIFEKPTSAITEKKARKAVEKEEPKESLLPALHEEIQALINGAQYEAASSLSAEAIGLDGHCLQTHLLILECLDLSGNVNRAIDVAQLIVNQYKTERDKAERWLDLGKRYMRVENNAEAIECFKRAKKRNKEDPSARLNLAQLYLLARKYSKALEELKSLKYEPGESRDVRVCMLFASVYSSANLPAEAIKWGQKACEVVLNDSDFYPSAVNVLCDVLRKDGKWEELLKTVNDSRLGNSFDDLSESTEELPLAIAINCAIALISLSHFNRAESHLRRLTTEPLTADSIRWHQDAAEALISDKKYSEAASLLERPVKADAAIRDQVLKGDLHYTYGKALLHIKRYSEAEGQAAAGLELFDQDVPIRLLLVESLMLQNKNEQAVIILAPVLEQRPLPTGGELEKPRNRRMRPQSAAARSTDLIARVMNAILRTRTTGDPQFLLDMSETVIELWVKDEPLERVSTEKRGKGRPKKESTDELDPLDEGRGQDYEAAARRLEIRQLCSAKRIPKLLGSFLFAELMAMRLHRLAEDNRHDQVCALAERIIFKTKETDEFSIPLLIPIITSCIATLEESDRYNWTKKLLKTMIEEHPTSPVVWSLLFQVMLRSRQDMREKMNDLRKMLPDVEPSDDESLLNLTVCGNYALMTRDWDRAVRFFTVLRRKAPESSQLVTCHAIAHLHQHIRLNESDTALGDAVKWLTELDEHDLTNAYNIGRLLEDSGEFETALAMYEKVLGGGKASESLRFAAAHNVRLLHKKLGHHALAEAVMKTHLSNG